jgi:hypothetical protein
MAVGLLVSTRPAAQSARPEGGCYEIARAFPREIRILEN